MTQVTLYTKRDCRLCDEAKAAIAQSRVEVELNEIDIEGDSDLFARFKNDVPVIYVDGAEAFRHRVDPAAFAAHVRGWRVVDGHHLAKEFRFPDFAKALAFTNDVGAIAEEQNHHPDIALSWGKVGITTWTHTIDGLSPKDFALAAKIDTITSGNAR
jgi:4a-hydroxytetrahydrobiopterin dehydratase